MKIFTETEALLKYPAGIAIYLQCLYRELARLLPDMEIFSGLQCMRMNTVKEWKHRVKQLMPQPVHNKVIFFPARAREILPQAVRKRICFHAKDYDLLHLAANGCPPWTPFDSLHKAVLTIHDMFPFHRDIPFPETAVIRHQLETLPQQAREAAAILTVSEFSKKEIIHFTGVEESKIFVTPIASQQPQDERLLNKTDSTILNRLHLE